MHEYILEGWHFPQQHSLPNLHDWPLVRHLVIPLFGSADGHRRAELLLANTIGVMIVKINHRIILEEQKGSFQ